MLHYEGVVAFHWVQIRYLYMSSATTVCYIKLPKNECGCIMFNRALDLAVLYVVLIDHSLWSLHILLTHFLFPLTLVAT